MHIKKIRPARAGDLAQVVAIDAAITGVRKARYWASVRRRYQRRYGGDFLVAEAGGKVQGYIVGEVRDWEFGEPPVGWVFGIGVRPEARLRRAGTELLEAICEAFRRRGVEKVRTLLARDDTLVLAFFRSQGMTAAPFIALEREL